ncbi:MAG: hypothetical protein M3463_23715, partial [Verrucomicrobiota bacterium]|nr:hypothetical protein [Verrucomicrobiota bacterium]
MRSSLLAFALLLSPLLGRAADPPPLRVAMFSGSKEYKSAETLPILKKELEGKYGVVCRVHLAEDKG